MGVFINGYPPPITISSRATTPLDPALYVDPAGSDAAAGTLASPLLTLGEALARLRATGWRGKPRITMAAGDYALGASPKILFPTNGAAGTSEPILLTCARVDSGLGTRTVASSTAGSGSTHGTVTETTGGLTVNAWRGWVLRFTSGPRLNFRYFIASNTATVYTLAGSLSVPTNGNTFVVEKPGSNLTWTGTLSINGHGSIVGFQDVGFVPSDTTGVFRWTNIVAMLAGCWFAGWGGSAAIGGFQIIGNVRFDNITTVTTTFSDNAALTTLGAYFFPGVASSPIAVNAGCAFNMQRSVYNNAAIDATQAQATILSQTSYHCGAAYVRAQAAATVTLVGETLDTITPAPAVTGAAQGAAIVIGKQAYGLLLNVAVSSTPATTSPGDAVLVAGGHADLSGVTGSGNAGAGVRQKDGGTFKNITGNTVTGTAGDVQIGGNAALTAWASVSGANDTGAATPQNCYAFGP
jgi:hypothetical protein